MTDPKSTQKPLVPFREMLRNFLIEMAVYGVLLVGYFYIALRYLAEPLAMLFNNNLVVYGIIGLALIIIQAVFLEFVTSFLFDFLGLHRLTSNAKSNHH